MRATTLFNRVLKLPGIRVVDVEYTDAGIIVSVVRRTGVHTCPCGWSTRSRYDASRRRWRHLDFGRSRVWIEAELSRIACRACGRVRTETVPWARDGARNTRDFETTLAWLAQRMDKTAISVLMRCSWETVDAAVRRVVIDHLTPDGEGATVALSPNGTIGSSRRDPVPAGGCLDGLRRIGIDEISYKRGHYYLTVIADHDTGRVVWVARERSQQAVYDFFDALGSRRTDRIEAVSLDASSIYLPAVTSRVPFAAICIDPFHVAKWVNEALDRVYLHSGQAPTMAGTDGEEYKLRRRVWARTRTALRTGKENLGTDQKALVNALRRHRYELFRAWELKEHFRRLYRSWSPHRARQNLKAWCTKALRSKIGPFVTVAQRILKHFEGIIAAVEHDLSNSRLEGINAKIRVVQRRGYGHRNPDALVAMVHLCLGGLTPCLPT